MSSRYDMSIESLEKSAHVPLEDQVQEKDTSPPIPDVLSEDDRIRQQVLRNPG